VSLVVSLRPLPGVPVVAVAWCLPCAGLRLLGRIGVSALEILDRMVMEM
jgi:hypothetical protein